MAHRYFVSLYYPHASEVNERAFYSQVHKVRDPQAALEVSTAIAAEGFRYGGLIGNIGVPLQEAIAREGGLVQAIKPDIDEDDLVLLPARPPLDDVPRPAERWTDRSEYEIENQVFGALRTVVAQCDRYHLCFQPNVLPAAGREVEDAYFRVYKGAPLVESGPLDGRRRAKRGKRLTLGYLIWIPRVEPIGFKALALFGFGGTETFIFSHLLGNHWVEHLRRRIGSGRTHVLVSEFEVPQWIPSPLLHYPPDALNARILVDC